MKARTGACAGAALCALIAALHLAYEATHGGVISHHLLADPSMPAVSNLLGLVTLPTLGALAGLRLAREVTRATPFWIGLGLALLHGAAIAGAFELGADAWAQRLFLTAFVLAVLLPVHRAECVLGLVLGMTFTFGAVIPTAIGCILAVVSRVLHPFARFVAARLRNATRRVP